MQAEAKPDGSSDVKLVLITALDRETQAEYHLSVVAYDGGDEEPAGSRSASLQVHVIVLDVNDNRPAFDHAHYEAVITSDYNLRMRSRDLGVVVTPAVFPDSKQLASDYAQSVLRFSGRQLLRFQGGIHRSTRRVL